MPLYSQASVGSGTLSNRRRVIHFNVIEHPTAERTARQIIEAFPDNEAPGYLLRDRDGFYGEYSRHATAGRLST
jgi:hypothetical protein